MEDNFTTAVTQLSARQHKFLGDQRLISNQSNIWSSDAVAYSNYLVFISFFVRKDWLVAVTQLDNLCIYLWLFVTDYHICLDDYLFCLDVQIAERERQSSVMHQPGWCRWGWGLSSWEWEDDQSADRADPHTTFRQLRHNSYGSGSCWLFFVISLFWSIVLFQI